VFDVATDNVRDSGKGLDVGTSFVRFAERRGPDIVLRSERNAFIDIERHGFTETMLTEAQAEYTRYDDHLYIVGTNAMRFANVLGRDARRPMSSGIISPSEKEALPIIELLVRGVVGPPRYAQEALYYSMPGPPLDVEANLVYHEKILQGLAQRLGYAARPINEGLAVVFSELADERFTGIGMSFGGGMVNVCFAFLSVPVLTFSLTTAGDWIDQQAALAVGERPSHICAVKESTLDLSKSEGLSKVEVALSICYDRLIRHVLQSVRDEFAKQVKMPPGLGPVPIVLAGGTALPKGFRERFEDVLRGVDFPVEIGSVRMAQDPLNCVAIGALVAAQAEAKTKHAGGGSPKESPLGLRRRPVQTVAGEPGESTVDHPAMRGSSPHDNGSSGAASV
jgi:actin-like ATPase involved in cell morphogenesis